jgi:hypothetical protein
MVSSRAAEYITRFSKGVQKKTALKKIIEYRDECKGLYHQAESKNPMNYRAAEDKREYLEDMLARIHCLGEARDHLEKEINKAPSKAKNNMRSAVAFKPEETTTESYAPPRPTKQNKKSSKEAKRAEVKAHREAEASKLFKKTDESKYVLRFQSLGLKDLDAGKCVEAAEEYMTVWETEMARNPDDEDYQERAEEAITALQQTIEYFEELSGEVDAILNPSVYNNSRDEYVFENSLGGYGSSDNEDDMGNRYD